LVLVAFLVGGTTVSAEVSKRPPAAHAKAAKATVSSPAKTDKVASIEADKAKRAAGDQPLLTPDAGADKAVAGDPSANAERTLATDPGANAERALATDPTVVEVTLARPGKPLPPPTSSSVMIQYQRIGREIHNLQQLRGTSCTLDLWAQFRAIKLEPSLAASQSRAAVAATLAEMQLRIERMKGITVHKSCLDNPLAPECQ
jgi:hypothetical protein